MSILCGRVAADRWQLHEKRSILHAWREVHFMEQRSKRGFDLLTRLVRRRQRGSFNQIKTITSQEAWIERLTLEYQMRLSDVVAQFSQHEIPEKIKAMQEQMDTLNQIIQKVEEGMTTEEMSRKIGWWKNQISPNGFQSPIFEKKDDKTDKIGRNSCVSLKISPKI